MPDPLEELVIDLGVVESEQLGRLLEECRPWPWKVVEVEDDVEDGWVEGGLAVVVEATGDTLALLPNDEYGRAHARLMAAAPLMALRLWNAARGK